MKPHKWAKEIKAWADGAEIEMYLPSMGWEICECPNWNDREVTAYRIKPQFKEPQYLLAVRLTDGSVKLGISGELVELKKGESVHRVIGKIKLEQDDD